MRLAHFDLFSVIGRGGMGEVWSGRHRATGLDVAIKVVKADAGDRDRFIQAFRNEVRAVAALDHPGIIRVFDQGVVSEREAGDSDGALCRDSPYLVMELANLGSLDSLRRQLTWVEIRYVLLGLLDALAYAHGAWLIHRDIKPANVLFSAPENARPGIKLTDFGLAHTYESGGSVSPSDARSGTPMYMAPEQFHGQWRDYGPWTDLYALGCVGWELATGTPPYGGASYIELARAQIQDGLPEFTPVVPVPTGFDAWLKRCLRKGPESRFQRAADAAHTLHQLPASAVGEGDAALFASEFGGDLTRDGWGQATTLHLPDLSPLAFEPAQAEPAPDWPIVTPPPLPRDWRRNVPRDSPPALTGAGLDMFGVRTLRLVDREDQRDALWAALHDCVESSATRVVVLHGPEGMGKARLGEWVSRRADEVGNAIAFRATHSAQSSPHDGLGMMLARYIRCEGLPRAEIVARAEDMARRYGLDDPLVWISIGQLIAGSPRSTRGSRDTQVERFGTLLRLLKALQRSRRLRPVIVRLENVQWGAEAVAFAFWMLLRAPNVPLLFVLTTTDPCAPGLPELLDMDGVEALEIGPLAREDHLHLVRDVMGLEPKLAQRVATQTAGSPLFARQLVGHFIERGVLRPSGSGFVLRAGFASNLPDDIHAVWMARVTVAVGEKFVHLAELAAVLGGHVARQEWHAAAGAQRPECPRLEECMLEAGLILPTEDGFEFAHAMLRESLLRRATEGRRLDTHHVACARALADLGTDADAPDSAGRVGRHLASAGRGTEAAGPLLQGAEASSARGGYDEALALLAMVDEAAIDASQFARACMARARIHRYRAEFQEAEAALEEARARPGLPMQQAALILVELSKLAMMRGALAESTELLAVLDGHAGNVGYVQGLTLHARATIALIQGDLPGARADITESARILEDYPEEADRVESLLLMGYVSLSEGDTNEAIRLFDRCLDWYLLSGNSLMTAVAYNHRGDALRRAADLDAAERDYRRSLEIAEPLRASHAAVARANLSLVCLARQQYGLAARYARQVFEQPITAELIATLHLVLAACAAAEEDMSEYANRLARARAAMDGSHSILYDVAWPAEAAGAAAAGAGRTQEAAAAYQLAAELWRDGGCDEDLARIEKVLSHLSAQG